MSGFYKNAAWLFLLLALITTLAAYTCIKRSYLDDMLLPAHRSAIPWQLNTVTDVQQGGASSIAVRDSAYSLDFDFKILRGGIEYPYVSFALGLKSSGQLVDLSNYSKATFSVLCKPHNVFTFSILAFDDRITKPDDTLTFRIPTEFFSCDETWKQIEIDIKQMTVPEWWLSMHNLDLSGRWDYRLNKVHGISFGISRQSPVDTPSNIRISELALHGRDWRYLYALWISAVLVWGMFIFWFFKSHTRYLISDIKEKMRQNWPLLGYQKLSVEPQKDREKTLLLQFIAKEYANPDLSAENAIAALGINRNKINEILKKELGFTFSNYLNKIRLTEAARLLSEKESASVGEIAYSVGYNNVSYFNKLFKNEYGCTPKTFKRVYKGHESPGADED